MAVKHIPESYHAVTPYLIVKGAVRAIEFYKEAFGATEIMRFPGPDNTIAHAEIKIGDSVVMLSDAPMGGEFRDPLRQQRALRPPLLRQRPPLRRQIRPPSLESSISGLTRRAAREARDGHHGRLLTGAATEQRRQSRHDGDELEPAARPLACEFRHRQSPSIRANVAWGTVGGVGDATVFAQ